MRSTRTQPDIAADYFALRKMFTGTKWAFGEGRNSLNASSHCDIAWAGALASFAHTQRRCTVGAATIAEDGTISSSDDPRSLEHARLWSDDPRIWRRVMTF